MADQGLLVDFGGVMTSNVFASFEAFCRAEGIEPTSVRDRFMGDPEARGLLEQLELGKLTEADFEAHFAPLLGVERDGLVDRLFGRLEPETVVIEAVRAARAAGIRTGLLSNSWGPERYDRDHLEQLFDTWVISGEVGLRKPDPAIYALAVERLGLPAERIVFVDDLPGNLKPARALGMTTVLHRDAARTVAELEQALGVALSGPA